jgi:hypothetical protein
LLNAADIDMLDNRPRPYSIYPILVEHIKVQGSFKSHNLQVYVYDSHREFHRFGILGDAIVLDERVVTFDATSKANITMQFDP